MRRGEVWLAELQPRSGAELRGPRPVIVVSRDSFNRVESWRSVLVVPLTTSDRQARRGPTAVLVPDGSGGLRGDGVAVCHQVTTLDRAKLTRRVGALPPEVLVSIEAGLKATLDLG